MKALALFAGVAAATAILLAPATSFAQDRGEFRNQARQSAQQMRALGEPMDRCSTGAGIEGGFVIDVFGSTPLQLGDRIINFNGADMSAASDEQIIAAMRQVAADARVQAVVLRGADDINVEILCTNSRPQIEPYLTALDHAARGRFGDCVEALNVSGLADYITLTLKLGCASFASRPERYDTGGITYQLAVKAIQAAHAVPSRRDATIAQLRASEGAITSARGASTFRELVNLTRTWPGDENAWARSEPDWALFRRNGEAALRRSLIDPESARIEWTHGFLLGSWGPPFASRIEGYWTCGLINARNRMGGYTGSTAFVVVISPEGQVRYSELGNAREFDILTAQCNNSVRLLPPRPPALTANATTTTPSATVSIADELERLVRLRDSGAITAAEFDAAKARLLGQASP